MKVGTRVRLAVCRHNEDGPQFGDLGTILEDELFPYIRWDVSRPGMHDGCKSTPIDKGHGYAVLEHFLERVQEEVVESQPSHSDNKIYSSEATLGEFYKVVEPVMVFINNHFDPHTRVIIDCTNAEIISGLACHNTMKFVKD